MGQMTNSKAKRGSKARKEIKKEERVDTDNDGADEQEQGGVSVHSPCKMAHSSLCRENSEVELELKLLEALEIYTPAKLRGSHRHFVLYGLTEYMRTSFDRPFTAEEVLKLLERFYNFEMVKADDGAAEFLGHEEDFCLPQSYFADRET